MPRCRCGPSARGRGELGSMSFASPYLLAALVLPLLALVGYLWLERRPPRAAISFPNLAVLASVATRSSWRRHLIAGPAARRRGAALRRRRPPAGPDRHDVRSRHGGARGRRVLLDGRDGRRPEPARGSAGRDHLVRQPRAEPRQGRSRGLCRRPRRRHLADDRPRPPQGGHRVARPRVRDGDRRRARSRRRSHAPVDRTRRDGRACRECRSRPARSCSSRTAPRRTAC